MALRQCDRHWDEAPVLLDIIARGGTIVLANRTETDALGLSPGALDGASMDDCYTRPSRRLIEGVLAGKRARAECVRLAMRKADGSALDVIASLSLADDPQHGPILRLAKLVETPGSRRDHLARLESDNEILSGIIETARDATYCVEFLEPVDLTAPEHEIIRQVFENACRWRYCNASMARLYRLPPGEDLNVRNVREVFARNPDNEAFVRQLIACGWHMNAAPSRDQRYDGLDMQVENDVRAHIVEGRLLRFWGVVRDPSSHRLKERQLRSEASQALDLLGAVPDPILVVNREGRVEGANPAVEWWLGWSLDDLLGNRIDQVLAFEESAIELISEARPGRQASRRHGTAIRGDGSRLSCDVSIAAIASTGAAKRVVMTLRSDSTGGVR